jgi:hypothetical protein
MTDPFQGDPRVFIDANGATLKFKDGQPVMDRGLENTVLMSWFSKKWFGNVFIRDENQQLNGTFEDAHRQPVTITGLSDRENAAGTDLDPLVASGTIAKYAVETTNTIDNKVTTTAVISPPGGDLFAVQATKNGANWIAQAVDPAYLRE